MKKVFNKYLDIHFQGINDKNGIFDFVTSCSIFDKYIFRRIFSYVLLYILFLQTLILGIT